jgi:xanthine dehydrogenase accessory factor
MMNPEGASAIHHSSFIIHHFSEQVMTNAILSALLASVEARRPVALATVTAAPDPVPIGRHAVVWLDAEPLGELGLGDIEAQALAGAQDVLRGRVHKTLVYATPAGQVQLFVEVQHRPPELIIVGAGHVAQPLAQLGKLCDFTVVVLDDRPQFANRQRFPQADEVLALPLRETMRQWAAESRLGLDSYVVLVTRGHQHDIDCLLEVLDTPLGYIGMIGSQRRVRTVFDLLSTEMGIPSERFDRVYAPIGIAIGARTPAEIAVCIMAEIINVQRGGPARSISDERREVAQQRRSRHVIRNS